MAVATPPSLVDLTDRATVRIVVWLRGEHDASTADAVADELARASATGAGDVIIDLSGVEFMDAAIVSVFAHGREALRSQSRRMTLRAPSAFARRVLDLCELGDLVEPVELTAPGPPLRGPG